MRETLHYERETHITSLILSNICSSNRVPIYLCMTPRHTFHRPPMMALICQHYSSPPPQSHWISSLLLLLCFTSFRHILWPLLYHIIIDFTYGFILYYAIYIYDRRRWEIIEMRRENMPEMMSHTFDAWGKKRMPTASHITPTLYLW